MSVQRRPKQHHTDITMEAQDRFIEGGTTAGRAVAGRKTAVSLRFDARILARIDEVAVKRGMSRNAIIAYWCSRALEEESHT